MYERFETFTATMVKIHRMIHQIKTEVMAECNLSSPHVSCLYYLGRAGQLTATGICEFSAEDKSSISRSIEYLKKEGYIVNVSEEQKRYKALLSLTEKGRAVYKKIEGKIFQVLAHSNDGISEENQKIFYDSLLRICDNLQGFIDKN